MNCRDFSETLLMGGSGLLLTGRAVTAAQPPLKLAIVSRTIEVNGRAATVFGLTGPDDKPGLTLAASETERWTWRIPFLRKLMVHWHGLLPLGIRTACPICQCRCSRPAKRVVTGFKPEIPEPTGCTRTLCRSKIFLQPR